MRDNKKSKFADLLKQARLKAKLTQSQTAKILGVSQYAIASWEDAISMPSSENLHKVAEKILGMSYEQLWAIIQGGDGQSIAFHGLTKANEAILAVTGLSPDEKMKLISLLADSLRDRPN